MGGAVGDRPQQDWGLEIGDWCKDVVARSETGHSKGRVVAWWESGHSKE